MSSPEAIDKRINNEGAVGVRSDFPIFSDESLVFLDSASSSQKPQVVIDALAQFYSSSYANIHRGNYQLSVEASERYEQARAKISKFLGAQFPEEIIFTSGATAGINLIAYAWARRELRAGDEVLISVMEHHSNIIPWQILANDIGVQLKWIGLTEDGNLDIEDFREKLNPKTKLVCLTQLSNVLGIPALVSTIVAESHSAGAKVLVDGAQGVAHLATDLQSIDADFYVFSGHKLYGPTGVGVVYIKKDILDSLTPVFGGGDMVASVSQEGAVWADLPYRFEAGTPNIAGVLGLSAAVDYVSSIGFEEIGSHERSLLSEMLDGLAAIPGVRVLGPERNRRALVAMTFEQAHASDVAEALSEGFSVAVRSGHHCAEPLHRYFGVTTSLRASLGIYSSKDDISRFLTALSKALSFFSRK